MARRRTIPCGGKRLIFSLLLVWLVILIYVSTFLFHATDEAAGVTGSGDGAAFHGGGGVDSYGVGGGMLHRRDVVDLGGGGGGGDDLRRRLDEAMRELEAVKRQNRDLQKMALEIREARHVVAQEMKGGEKMPKELVEFGTREAKRVEKQKIKVEEKVPQEVAVLRRRLEKALKELEKASFSAGNIHAADAASSRFGAAAAAPSSVHELTRMRIENTVKEANRFFIGQIKALKDKFDAAIVSASKSQKDAKKNGGGGGLSENGEFPGGFPFSDPRGRTVVDSDNSDTNNDNNVNTNNFNTNNLVSGIAASSSSRGAFVGNGAAAEWMALVGGASTQLASILSTGGEHLRFLGVDLEQFRDLDGLGDWRRWEAQQLSQIVQNRLDYLQNPKDCKNAKKLVCNLNKGCGYGCQLHHAVYCLVVAFASGRTLILESLGWRYHPEGGWDSVFQPISRTCLISNAALQALEKRTNDTRSQPFTNSRRGSSSRQRKKRLRTNIPWGAPALHPEALEVEIPIIDSINPRPNQLPLAVPEDLKPHLERFHASPPVWWIGQLLKFLLKPKPKLSKLIKDTGDRLGFSHPVVGVHVRRTDKVGTEAAFHSVEEYMRRVDEWFKNYELLHPLPPSSSSGKRKRNVFLATDEPLLLDEAKTKFPEYNFISDNNISKSAGLTSRYSEESLHGIILDIHFLANADFLVCTFSSQVCRVAYELMQSLHPDASDKFSSLDDIFYFGGQNAHNVRAIYPHHPTNTDEMQLQVGDLIGIAGNHWDGFSKGRNRRSDQTGLFPSFKVQDAVDWVPFPRYDLANNHTTIP